MQGPLRWLLLALALARLVLSVRALAGSRLERSDPLPTRSPLEQPLESRSLYCISEGSSTSRCRRGTRSGNCESVVAQGARASWNKKASHLQETGHAVASHTPLSWAIAAIVPHTPTQVLLGRSPPGRDLRARAGESSSARPALDMYRERERKGTYQ